MSTLTPAQQQEAEEAYIYNNLFQKDKLLMERRSIIENAMGKLSAQQEELEKECGHPLILRDAVNEGTSGNWDNAESFWTRHHCKLCGKRWNTGQRWKHVGGKHGHPDDEEARKEDY